MRDETRPIVTLFRNELRMLLRSPRTIVMSIILPLLVMPLMLLVARWTANRRAETLEGTVYSYAVVGSQAEEARRLLDSARARAGEEGEEFLFTEVVFPDPAESLESGDLHFYLDAMMGPEEVSALPVLTFYFRADRDASEAGVRRMRHALWETRRIQRNLLLLERGFPVQPSDVAAVEDADVATAAQSSGLQLGRFLTLFLMLFLLTGGSVVAIDSLAGEKERGTLETLLTTAVSRFEIVAAKHLAILAVAIFITVIQVANLLAYVGFELIPLPEGFTTPVSPLVAALLLVLYLPVASLVSSVLLLTSGYAKTYKEAQLYLSPVLLISLLPALAPILPGIELHSAIVALPVANISVAVKEILAGTFDWPMIVLAWLVTAGSAAYTARLSARSLSTEKLITASEIDEVEFQGGPALFPRRVLRWFAVMWAILFVAAANMEATTDIRLQLFFNLGVLFLGGSLLMVTRYRLNISEALALRPVKPLVWIAVLVGVPSGLLLANGLFELSNLIFPVPERMVEGFSQALLPEHIPFWQMLLFLSVLPGICEEIAFRGVLLYGLRRRFHPALVPLVVGLIFGLFHFSLFRIVPTAFLGVILAVVTMLTGSIFPAMLWHALNNAATLLVIRSGASVVGLDTWLYVTATPLLAAAFWILWRHRSLYPGLRPWRPPHAKVADHSRHV